MKVIERMKKPILLIVALIPLIVMNYCAYGFRLNVDPPRVDLSIAPGQEKGGSISVYNDQEHKSIHVKAYINDLVYLPDGSNDFLPEGSTPWTISDWLKIGPTEFDIPPKGEVKVRYIAEVPKDAKGGRYGVAFFEVSPPLEELQGKTGAAINIRLGTIFLIAVEGTEQYSAVLEDIRVGKPDKDGSFEISCTVRNGGNILVRPNGPVKIIDSAKTEVAQVGLNLEKSGVLPGTNRQFIVKYDRGKLIPGEYFVQVVFDYGGEDFLGGQKGFKIE